VEDGVLVVSFFAPNAGSNVGNIGYTPKSIFETVPVLVNGIDWRYQRQYDQFGKAKIEKHLNTIKEAIGKEVTYEVQWDVLGKSVAAIDGSEEWNFRSSEWLANSLDGLQYNIQTKCKDSMIKEALLEKWTTGVIIVRVDKDLAKKFPKQLTNAVDFESGKLVILFARSGNQGYCGTDLEERL